MTWLATLPDLVHQAARHGVVVDVMGCDGGSLLERYHCACSRFGSVTGVLPTRSPLSCGDAATAWTIWRTSYAGQWAPVTGMHNDRVRMLVLGGSWFVGRVVAQEAIERGFEVTVFHRGRSGVPPAGARIVHGDREDIGDLKRLAALGPWDVVVDVAGSVPTVVGASSRVLADVSERLVFVSTISAYRDWPHERVDESSALWDGDPDFDPGTRAWDPDAYGPLKLGCEIASRRFFDHDRLLILRPHVVLGRYEYVGRLPWWLGRMRRGGRVLAPWPDRPIQPVDVRDLSRFLLDLAQTRATGVFNVAAPPDGETFGDMLTACSQMVAEEALEPVDLVWVDEDWLVAQRVTEWTELPLWRNASAPWGMSVQKALAAGLQCRPLADTVADTWRWLVDGGQPVPHERFAQHGIDPAKEASLISRWLARGQNSAG